jgi:hypothetical protein
MASHRIETYCQRLAFPIGALIFSRAVDHLVRAGRLDPIPYFRRHNLRPRADSLPTPGHAIAPLGVVHAPFSLEHHHVPRSRNHYR